MNNWGLIVGLCPIRASFAGDVLSVKDAGCQTDSSEQRCQKRKYALLIRPSPESRHPVSCIRETRSLTNSIGNVLIVRIYGVYLSSQAQHPRQTTVRGETHSRLRLHLS